MNTQTKTSANRPLQAGRRRIGGLLAVAVLAVAAFTLASAGPFADSASAGNPGDITSVDLPVEPELPEPDFGPALDDGEFCFPGAEVECPPPCVGEECPFLPVDPVDPVDPVNPDLEVGDLCLTPEGLLGPCEEGPVDPVDPGLEVGDLCVTPEGLLGPCEEGPVIVPPTTPVPTVDPPVEVEGETATPVGELAFTGSNDTVLRLGAVLAIGGVAAAASAAAMRRRQEG
ncbi:MAG: hypothetical protein ACKO5A_07575 [Actinomycetota bacterium]